MKTKIPLSLFLSVMPVFIVACGAAKAHAAEVPAATETSIPMTSTPIIHTMLPGDATGSLSIANDTNSQITAMDRYTAHGDIYPLNRFERPFTRNDMTYLPALDIQALRVGKDANWYYLVMPLSNVDPTSNSLNGNYGAEIDLNRDGRGEILIWAQPPFTTDWSTTPVTVYADKNGDVGGANPFASDAPSAGDGYETIIFNSGQGSDPDLAWVRISPDLPSTIEFAFKPSLLNGAASFQVGGWADAGLMDPSRFNYNDFFTLADAGTSMHSDPDYPIKAIYAVDNTCRAAVGFTVTSADKMACQLAPTPTATLTFNRGPQPILVPTLRPVP